MDTSSSGRTGRSRTGAATLAAAVAVVVAATPASAGEPSTAPPQPEITGLALGPDRLPSCTAVVAAMPTRLRLAQRLMVGADAADPQGAAEMVGASQVGGVFLGGNATELLSDQALRAVQAVSRIPLAVAVDDEGGRVQRVDTLDGDLPSAREMAAELSPLEVRELARDRARALVARGITMNLAPTVDVGDQPDDGAIGDRSFGSDPAVVTTFAGAFAQGQREAGVYTVLKHFPGHGNADGDSHQGRVRTPPLEELRESDLVPYAELVGPGKPLSDGRTGVMIGHLDVPGLTTELPTSLTPAVYALLRDELRFDGLVMTDDLGAMKAITGTFELPEAVERALAAGADIALWSSGGEVAPVLDALEQALAQGRLDAAANDRATERVLAAKRVCSR